MAEKAGVHAKAQKSKQKCSNFCKRKSGYNSSGLPADRMLQLERTAGNQAVQRLIKSRSFQAKLRVGQPNDVYEQEADRVAEQVMRMPDPILQRKCPNCDEDEKKVLQAKEFSGKMPAAPDQNSPPLVHEALRSPGQPLDFSYSCLHGTAIWARLFQGYSTFRLGCRAIGAGCERKCLHSGL